MIKLSMIKRNKTDEMKNIAFYHALCFMSNLHIWFNVNKFQTFRKMLEVSLSNSILLFPYKAISISKIFKYFHNTKYSTDILKFLLISKLINGKKKKCQSYSRQTLLLVPRNSNNLITELLQCHWEEVMKSSYFFIIQ